MKGNLLIIDDEEVLLENMRQILADLADTIFACTSGFDALKVLETENIHCIVCDINMPKMTGDQVIQETRKINKEVPFIFFTGHGNSENLQKVIHHGVFDFLNKPNFERLEESVQRGLKQSTSIPKTDSIDFSELLKDLDSNDDE